jgi:hypothetical protein
MGKSLGKISIESEGADMPKKKDELLEKVLRDFNREVEQIKRDLPWPPKKK